MAPKEMPKESKPKGPKKSKTPSQPEAPQIDPTDFSPQDKDRLDGIVRNKLYLDNLIVPKKDSISHSWRLSGWKDEVRWKMLLFIYISDIDSDNRFKTIRRVLGHQNRLWLYIPPDAIEGIYLEAKRDKKEYFNFLCKAIAHFKTCSCFITIKGSGTEPCKNIIRDVPHIKERWAELQQPYKDYQDAVKEIEQGAPPMWADEQYFDWYMKDEGESAINLFKDPPGSTRPSSRVSGRHSTPSDASRPSSLSSRVSGRSEASDPFRDQEDDPENPFADSVGTRELWNAFSIAGRRSTSPESIQSTQSQIGQSAVAQGKRPESRATGRDTPEPRGSR